MHVGPLGGSALCLDVTTTRRSPFPSLQPIAAAAHCDREGVPIECQATGAGHLCMPRERRSGAVFCTRLDGREAGGPGTPPRGPRWRCPVWAPRRSSRRHHTGDGRLTTCTRLTGERRVGPVPPRPGARRANPRRTHHLAPLPRWEGPLSWTGAMPRLQARQGHWVPPTPGRGQLLATVTARSSPAAPHYEVDLRATGLGWRA